MINGYRHVSGSDVNEKVLRFLGNKKNHGPLELRNNMNTKESEELLGKFNCHLYTAGPPCPPFSQKTMNKLGFNDKRAALLKKAFSKARGPLAANAAVIENVIGLLDATYAEQLEEIIKCNTQAGYLTAVLKTDPNKQALPCGRPRAGTLGC